MRRMRPAMSQCGHAAVGSKGMDRISLFSSQIAYVLSLLFFLIYVMSPPLLYFDTSASSKQQGPIAAQCSILGPDRSRVDFSCAAHLTRSVYISH